MRRREVLLVLAGSGLAGLAGCSGGPAVPKTVATGGTVLWKGTPLANAYVTFAGQDGQSAVGQTDAQGKFQLTSHYGPNAEAKGVVPRDYKVTISKMVPPGTMTEEQYQQIRAAANAVVEAGGVVAADKKPPQLVELLPAKYSSGAKTELTAKVTDKDRDFKFDLN